MDTRTFPCTAEQRDALMAALEAHQEVTISPPNPATGAVIITDPTALGTIVLNCAWAHDELTVVITKHGWVPEGKVWNTITEALA